MILSGIDITLVTVVSVAVNRRIAVVARASSAAVVLPGTKTLLITGVDRLFEQFRTAIVGLVIVAVAIDAVALILQFLLLLRQFLLLFIDFLLLFDNFLLLFLYLLSVLSIGDLARSE